MAGTGRWGGYAKAVLRGIAAGIPIVGPAIAEVLKHAEEKKLEAKVDQLVRRIGRGEASREQDLRSLPEEDVERAVAESVARLPEKERKRLTEGIQRAASPEEAIGSAIDALAAAPSVRHSMLSYACRRIGDGQVLAPGDRIDGRYEVIELVGMGGMGSVYRARDIELDEDVVLKFLRSSLASDPACARRFVQEAKVGLSLTHEGIVRIRDVRKSGETSYLTMEWVEGPTLRAFLGERGALAWEDAEPIVHGVLSALAYAHGKGVLHLDLKPENVLLPRPDSPKICDFGLARVAEKAGGVSLLPGAGTPQYMSPEQQRGADLDARADVFAAGVMLYEMLTGELPVGMFEPLPESVPRHVREGIEAALSQRKEKRPKDAAALLARLGDRAIEVPEIEPIARPRATNGGGLAIAGLSFIETNSQGFEEYRHKKTGMELIYVPAGEFRMGSESGLKHEKPAHRVVLEGYLIGKYQVTNGEYRAFCKATGDTEPAQPSKGYGHANYFGDSRYDKHPVVCVSWLDAKAYCEWAELRLPTEAEWEFAARGKDGRKYPWGNEAPDETRANYGKWSGDGYYTRTCGSYPAGASACGGLDMAGNVWEWCSDWYDEKYYARCGDGARSPQGPDGGSSRVVRGGSWGNDDAGLRGADRDGNEPGFGYFYLGFRVARSPAR